MTEDQAVAWLLLEGYAIGEVAGTLRWLHNDDVPRKNPVLFTGEERVQMGGVTWRQSEFIEVGWDGRLVSVTHYPQYAPAVVKLLTEKENEP